MSTMSPFFADLAGQEDMDYCAQDFEMKGFSYSPESNLDIEEVLGEGSYGTVFRVHDNDENQEYALKVIELAPDEIETSLREVSCMARIVSPHVVQYKNHWLCQSSEEEDTYKLSIQMELIKGESLSTMITPKKSISYELMLKIFRNLVIALRDIHMAGVIHRDLSPSNIIVRPDGSVVVIDFGISSINPKKTPFKLAPRPESMPHAGPFQQSDMNEAFSQLINQASSTLREAGTPLYSSPQQLKGMKSSESDDIYSLGIIVFEMFSNFSTSMERAKVMMDFKKSGIIPLQFEKMYPTITSMLQRMTHPDQNQRPTAEELLTESIFV